MTSAKDSGKGQGQRRGVEARGRGEEKGEGKYERLWGRGVHGDISYYTYNMLLTVKTNRTTEAMYLIILIKYYLFQPLS